MVVPLVVLVLASPFKDAPGGTLYHCFFPEREVAPSNISEAVCACSWMVVKFQLSQETIWPTSHWVSKLNFLVLEIRPSLNPSRESQV